MPFPAKSFQKNYVPFVRPTVALNGSAPEASVASPGGRHRRVLEAGRDCEFEHQQTRLIQLSLAGNRGNLRHGNFIHRVESVAMQQLLVVARA